MPLLCVLDWSTMAARKRKAPQAPEHKVNLALGLLSECETRYAARNQIISDMRRRRFQDEPVEIPANYRSTTREVRLSLLADTIDLMTAIVDDAPWIPHVDPYDVGPTAERNSSLREKWTIAAVKQSMLDLNRPAISYSAANQMADGLGVLKVVYRPDSWRELPTAETMFGRPASEITEAEAEEYDRAVEKRKRGMRLPFSVVDVDPLSFYPVYGPDGETEAVIEVTERPVHQAVLQYSDAVQLIGNHVVPINAMGEPQPPEGSGNVDETRSTVRVWEYWDRECSIVFIDTLPVKYTHHGIGEVPYFEAYAKPSPDRDPAKASRPGLYKLVWIMDLLNSLWTMMSNATYLYSYPTPTVTTETDADVPLDADGRPVNVEWEPGKLMDLRRGQSFSFVAPPTQHLALMSEMISQGLRMFEASTGLGPAIRGLTGSDASGYQVNQMIQASMLSLHPAIKSRDLQLARMIVYIWRLIEHRIKADVWVWGADPGAKADTAKRWLKLGPSDIDGYYKCEVESKPMIDQMRISRMAAGIQAVKAELLDPRTCIEEWMGYPDPDAILDAIAVHKEMREGKLHDLMVEGALRKAHLIPPKPAGPPPGGPPGMPGGDGAGLGPQAPGVGMPLVPEAPTPQAPGPQQMAREGGIAGRPAGGDRMPPQPMPRPINPGVG